LGPGAGIMGALKAFGATLVSFATNPLTLATIGLAAAAGAVSLFYKAVTGGSRDVEAHMERHSELIDQIRARWQAAADGVHNYAESSRAVLVAEATRSREALESDFAAMARGLAPTALVGSGVMRSFGVQSATIQAFPAIEAAVRRLQEQAREGAPDVRAFREEISRLFTAAPAGSVLRDVAGFMLDASTEAATLQGQLEQARDAEKGLTGDTRAMNRALGEAAASFASTERKAKDYSKALEALQGIGRLKLSDRGKAAEQLRLAADAAQGLDDITVAMNDYAAALDRVTAAERRTDLEALADLDFTRATRGLSDHAAGLAEINRNYDNLIAKRREDGAETALLERRRQREIDQLTTKVHGEFDDLIAERRRALEEEAGALGLSESALARYRTEIELTNAAMQMFGAVSPEMAAQIRELGDAAAANVEAQRQMRDQIRAMDEMRGDVRSFLGDFAGGLRQGASAADALLAAMNRLLDRLFDMGLDMITDSLFGQRGTAGGGMVGGLFSGLVPGAGGSGGGTGQTPAAIFGGLANTGAGAAIGGLYVMQFEGDS
jgi:hypothetical protein